MMRIRSISMSAFAFLCLVPTNLMAQYVGTLYSPYKYPNQKLEHCLNFQTGLNTSKFGPCDLRYGFLGINNDFDWLQSSMGQEVRTVIKDLGPRSWTDSFDVPVVAPLPKLKPGEVRSVTIDASGADGTTGSAGARGSSGGSTPRVDPGSGVIEAKEIMLDSRESSPTVFAPAPPTPPRQNKPKVDPAFTKAIMGHMYVVHVVDEVSDYYALFRVDALGDGTCTISWKLIPAPQK